MKEKVFCADLRLGMYVAELDRPWLDTPFLFQGFALETEEQIAELRQYCGHVYVDRLRSAPESLTRLVSSRARPAIVQQAIQGDASAAEVDEKASPTQKLMAKLKTAYPDTRTVEEELPEAKRIHEHALRIIEEAFSAIRDRAPFDAAQIADAVDGMTESIVRNPDALTLLTWLKRKSAQAYGRSISTGIHMLAFGRHMGFPKDQLHQLGTGGLLLDVGMVRLPENVLAKRGKLTPEEYDLVKNHVKHAVEILREASGIAPKIVDIVASHHEREDGSGYPFGLKGSGVSILGKMAAIVDCYQGLTSERPYAQTLSPNEALQMLYDWRGTFFNEDLVEQFIQCVGIYPVGSLVELNSGEVAIVLAHNRVRRLKPKVMIILDPHKEPYSSPITIDLLTVPKRVGDEPYAITQSLQMGMYGVKPEDYYL